MQLPIRYGCVRLCLAVGVALALVGCTTKERIFYVEGERNSPPIILQTGPRISGDSLELRPEMEAPRFSVLVADTNGIDDISGVALSIESVSLNRIIARPNAYSTEACSALDYRDFDTIGLQSLLASTYPGLRGHWMSRAQGGLFLGPPLCAFDSVCTAFPGIQGSTDAVGMRLTGCYTRPFGTWLAHWSLQPPAVVSASNIFITYLDVSYLGVTVTVYDGAGNSTSTVLPDLRIIYTTDEERYTEP